MSEERQIDDPIVLCATTLTNIRQRKRRKRYRSWDMCIAYNSVYEAIRKYIHEVTGQYPSRQAINRRIRAVPDYNGPSGNWLANARKVAETFPEITSLGNGQYPALPYSHYVFIATSSGNHKRSVLDWAITNQASQAEIAIRIRQQIKDEVKPDFELKTTNVWRFSKRNKPNSFEGGIYPDIIANLIHYFTNAGDTVIDPMAGAGTTAYVVEKYLYFQRQHPNLEHSGHRYVLLADIAPTQPDILENDATQGLPWEDNIAQLAILDPPYFGISNGKYRSLGDSINTWRLNLCAIMQHCMRCVRPGGFIAVIVDDFNRTNGHHPLSVYTMIDAVELGLMPARTIYNLSGNFIYSMNGAQMNKAKSARLPVNDMKIIHVFEVITSQGKW